MAAAKVCQKTWFARVAAARFLLQHLSEGVAEWRYSS
jgi:hypothetical protein